MIVGSSVDTISRTELELSITMRECPCTELATVTKMGGIVQTSKLMKLNNAHCAHIAR